MMHATVQAEGERNNATPEAMAVAGISIKMEFDGLVGRPLRQTPVTKPTDHARSIRRSRSSSPFRAASRSSGFSAPSARRTRTESPRRHRSSVTSRPSPSSLTAWRERTCVPWRNGTAAPGRDSQKMSLSVSLAGPLPVHNETPRNRVDKKACLNGVWLYH